MTRIANVADVHLGNHRQHGGATRGSINDRCREGLDVLHRALMLAVERRCDWFVVHGDLFDTDRPPPALIAEVQQMFSGVAAYHCGVVLVLGNHDMTSSVANDSAMAPLAPVAHVVVRASALQLGGARLVALPHEVGFSQHTTETLGAALDGALHALGRGTNEDPTGPVVVGMHLGISDDSTPPWLRGAADSVPIDVLMPALVKRGIRWAVAGNWHDRRAWFDSGTTVLQLGALVPTGWDNPGLDGYGTVAIVDTDRPAAGFEIEEVPGPRFVVADSLDDARRVSVAASARPLYVRLRLPPEQVADGRALLAELGLPGDVAVDAGLTTAAARTAATLARGASTLDEAVAAFVAEMPLDAGVDRARVLAHVQRFVDAGRKGA